MQVCDLLSFYVDIENIGTHAITVTVEVYAERRPADPRVVKVTKHAHLRRHRRQRRPPPVPPRP